MYQRLDSFLSSQECSDLIQRAHQIGIHAAIGKYPSWYRSNQRCVFDDAKLAEQLAQRLRMRAPDLHFMRINPRWRICRYQRDQAFFPHQDGVFHDGQEASQQTFMIYLNSENFTGGDTVFYRDGENRTEANITARVTPKTGTLMLFDHALWHAGEVVTSGEKYLLRSDLMFDRSATQGPGWTMAGELGDLSHRGYVWCLYALNANQVLSGGRDGKILLWRNGYAQRSWQAHTQSVFAVASNSQTILSASRDDYLKTWDRSDFSPRQSVKLDSTPICACVQAEQFWVGCANGEILAFDQHLRLVQSIRAHQDWVFALAIEGEMLFSVSADRSLHAWQLESGSHRMAANRMAANRMTSHRFKNPLRSLAVHQDQLAIGDSQGVIHRLEFVAGRFEYLRAQDQHTGHVSKIRALSRGRWLSCGEDGSVWVSDDQSAAQRIVDFPNFATDALMTESGGLCSGYFGVQRLPFGFCAIDA